MPGPQSCFVVNRAKNLNAMIECLDVDATKLARLRAGAAYAQARDTCLRCHQAHTCTSWIELAPQGARPDFCPNQELLASVG
jgi:Family of unknown function (DUF6455)